MLSFKNLRFIVLIPVLILYRELPQNEAQKTVSDGQHFEKKQDMSNYPRNISTTADILPLFFLVFY